jgi:regulator of extracellular matrix RemA (YlzA/DUF370 family)
MEEETRDEIIDIVNNEEAPVKEEIKEEPVKEEVIKPKAKRASRAKVKIVKESVEPVEPIVVDEPVVEVVEVIEKPEPKVDKLKSIVQCPDCLLSMTQHTLKYIHKRRGFCKAVKTEAVPEKTPEPVPDQPKLKPKITEDIVNEYIKDNPDIVSTYLRNERAMKAQRKQMNARSLLNNAF